MGDDDEAPENAKKGTPENMSKSALKNKKRKAAAKNKAKTAEQDKTDALAAAASMNQSNNQKNNYQGAAGILADPDKEKKIRKVNDKLAKIEKGRIGFGLHPGLRNFAAWPKA